jgi:hypothetical protein
MYQEVEGHPRMTINEATERYPNNYIVMRMDNRDISNDMGTLLYIGDDQEETISLMGESDATNRYLFAEGLHLMSTLGGVAVGG